MDPRTGRRRVQWGANKAAILQRRAPKGGRPRAQTERKQLKVASSAKQRTNWGRRIKSRVEGKRNPRKEAMRPPSMPPKTKDVQVSAEKRTQRKGAPQRSTLGALRKEMQRPHSTVEGEPGRRPLQRPFTLVRSKEGGPVGAEKKIGFWKKK